MWHLKTFEQLSKEELYQILLVRNEVFILEQNCPYQDLDEKDFPAYHLFFEQDNKVQAYCRLMAPGVNYEQCSIGRVMTVMSVRKTGMGKVLMQKAIDYMQEFWPNQTIKISAQLYLEKFYADLGFKSIGETYLEDNIPHIAMLIEKN